MPTLQEVLKERYDDAPGGARGLGQLKKAKSIKGFIGSFDTVDYYRVKLTGRSSLAVSLSDMKAEVKLRILDAKGSSIAKGKKSSVTTTLEAGTYFVQVSRKGTATNYMLKASVSGSSGSDPGSTPVVVGTGTLPPNDSKDPGSLPGTALDTGKLDTTKSYKGVVGSADVGDFYRFTVDKPTQFSSVLSDVVGGGISAKLVYDINGNGFVDAGDEIGDGLEIKKSLGAGTYFLGVSPASSDVFTTYSLKLSGVAITGISTLPEPPIGLGKATDLGTVSTPLSLKQIVGSTDSTDIYKFTLNSVSNFSTLLNSSQSTGNVTMSLIYDQDNNGIANPGEVIDGYVNGGDFLGGLVTNGGAGGAALGINRTLGAGTYYLAITQKELVDNTTYSLNLLVNSTVAGITPTVDPGSTMGTSTNLGVLAQTTNVKQFVGSVDRSDFYRFTLSQERNVIVSYNGTPDLVAIRFGQDRDGNGFFNPNEDVNGNKKLDFNEDLNNNGILDAGEDTDKDGYLLRSEDLNLNGFLDPNEVLEPTLSGNVVYSPLPPFYDSSAKFDYKINAFLTTVPTNIYAKLPAGTYYLQVAPQSQSVDLGDGLVRYGSANVLYNLSFQLDG
jgi:Bacterial pre-peptidase C-terminal domain